MVARTEETATKWHDGAVRDVHDDMMELTLAIVADTLFGVDVGRNVDTVGDALEVVMNYQEGYSGVLPVDLPTPARLRLDRAIEDLEGVVYRIVDERAHDPGDDVVSRMLAMEDEEGRGMSREQVRDEVMTLLLAGHETTVLALTFTWFLLAQHPTVEERLVAELDEELASVLQVRFVLGGVRVPFDRNRLPEVKPRSRISVRCGRQPRTVRQGSYRVGLRG
jgi:cytochrome P450